MAERKDAEQEFVELLNEAKRNLQSLGNQLHIGGGAPFEAKCTNGRIMEIEKAANGLLGEDQRLIAKVGVDWVATLLAKNRDYGSSAWKAPVLCPGMLPGQALLCRMSDKIERIAKLSTTSAAVTSESLEDTVKDLGAYCLLWLTLIAKEASEREDELQDLNTN